MVCDFVVIEIKNNYLKNKYNAEIGDKIKIKTTSLPKGSHVLVKCYCDICGKKKEMMYKTYFKLISKDKDSKYYCHKCSIEKTKKTNKEKYGVEYVCQNEKIFNKVKQTKLERYGVEFVSQLEKYELKRKATNKERYGVEHPQQNKQIREKTIKTMIEKYGVKAPIQNVAIKEKIKRTNIKKYNNDNVLKNEDIRNKIISTLNNKTIEKYKNIVKIFNITRDYYECLCDKEHVFKIEKSLLNQRIKYKVTICTVCNPVSLQTSDSENKILNFIKNNYKHDIILNSRDIIPPCEIDIYLPDIKLAFEYNGLYWHSNIYKDDFYHFNKTERCLSKDIQLIHIYEDDWNVKQDIIKSIILYKLNKITNKISAKKCCLKEIDDEKIVENFLNTNHINGYQRSDFNIGLFYNDELVTLMTFNKLQNKVSEDNIWINLRYCSKLYTVVVGGASKLFKYFTNKYEPNKVISYVDRSYFNGGIFYEKMNFKLKEILVPSSYFIINDKKVLVSDDFLNKTSYRKISDSGSCKFIYENVL